MRKPSVSALLSPYSLRYAICQTQRSPCSCMTTSPSELPWVRPARLPPPLPPPLPPTRPRAATRAHGAIEARAPLRAPFLTADHYSFAP